MRDSYRNFIGDCYIIFPIVSYNFLLNRICSNVGVRDCPYGICCPWVRGGWGFDALGKFFRRRRRRRPRQIGFQMF